MASSATKIQIEDLGDYNIMFIENPNLEEQLRRIDDKIQKAEADGSDIEIRDALIEKGDLYLNHRDHINHRANYLKAIEKTVGSSKKLELYLTVLNSYYVTDDIPKFIEVLAICKVLNDEGGDWEKKNKLHVYEGILMIIKRDLTAAANLFLSSVNTFNAPEIISFETLVRYAAVLGMVSLSRKEVKERLIGNSEVISVLNEDRLLNDFVFTIFDSNYQAFFPVILSLHGQLLETDRFLKVHRKFIVKRARIVIYSQYLESYKTVRLDKMARDFGVGLEFLDRELSDLIASKQLNCQIDKVNGVVESSRGDARMTMYHDIVRKGDNLIERMHKLSKFAQA